MGELRFTQEEIERHIAIIDGKLAPNIVITNATYLHSIYKKWIQGNIWIDGERIVYAGAAMPEMLDGVDLIDANGKYIVPGYIDPHVHPFQLYSPWSFAEYAAQLGTTTFISDNLMLYLLMENEEIFTIIDEMQTLPFSFYWWARFDSQTVLQKEREIFNEQSIAQWIERSDVLMAGELTGWPKLVAGDLQMAQNVRVAKKAGKKLEGHYPGASERTLARMKLFGTDGDHEAMTADEVEARLLHGYGVTIRYSSIRPDLPSILTDLVAREHNVFDHLMMTTDGSTPGFHLDGVMDKCIRAAMEAGVKPIDAYLMASYNIAKYYDLTDAHGLIATGRFATLNFLCAEDNPVPTDILSKGVWLKREGEKVHTFASINTNQVPAFRPTFSLTKEDFDISHAIGIEMVNDVITKPYEITVDHSVETLSSDHDENFLLLIDRAGKWRLTTILKGFATNVEGVATSYSNTGDIIVIGKSKEAMTIAFEAVKDMQGGIVLVENGQVIHTIPLPIGGGISEEPMERLMAQEIEFKQALATRGYPFSDAVYTFLFLQSTHLPYIRMTQVGLFDVMAKKIIIPVIERKI